MKVYVAGPYTKGDVAMNVHDALVAAERLVALGHIPYVPHLTHFWHLVYPHDIQFWYDYDLIWLKCCDCVLRLHGESKGADKEVEVAKSLGIPVYEYVTAIPIDKS